MSLFPIRDSWSTFVRLMRPLFSFYDLAYDDVAIVFTILCSFELVLRKRYFEVNNLRMPRKTIRDPESCRLREVLTRIRQSMLCILMPTVGKCGRAH